MGRRAACRSSAASRQGCVLKPQSTGSPPPAWPGHQHHAYPIAHRQANGVSPRGRRPKSREPRPPISEETSSSREAGRSSHRNEHHSEAPSQTDPLQAPQRHDPDLAAPSRGSSPLDGEAPSNGQACSPDQPAVGGKAPARGETTRTRSSGGDLHAAPRRRGQGGRAGRGTNAGMDGGEGGRGPAAAAGRPEAAGNGSEGRQTRVAALGGKT
nr:myristoylated alanine-rich C-kinase substrate-like [Aegilops tauschii subsp. strangulata]